MEDESAKDKLAGIVPSGSGAIAKSSASLMGRGLRSLSGWDAARVIEAGKELTSACYKDLVLLIIKIELEKFLKPPIWSLWLVDSVASALNELCEKAELYYEVPGRTTIPRGHPIKMDDTLIRHVAESRSSVVITDVQTNPAILAQVQESHENRHSQSSRFPSV